MKIMKALLLILTFLTATINRSSAQKWAPLGMTWTYQTIRDMWTPSDWKVTTLKAIDTVTRYGKLCTIIQDMSSTATDTSFLGLGCSFLTYEESGVVYLLSPITKKFTVLYDFNKNVGEGWSIYGMPKNGSTRDTSTCPVAVIVDAVEIVTINGHTLKKMRLSSKPGTVRSAFSGTIIEGIGHTEFPFPWTQCISGSIAYYCEQFTDCMNHYSGLRCIDNGELGFYDFKRAPHCDWTRTSINEISVSDEASVFPNPAQGFFTVKLGTKSGSENYAIQVCNQFGQIVCAQGIREATTNIKANWPSGMYFYQLSSEGTPIQSGKIMLQ
jgi:hypothetical protein